MQNATDLMRVAADQGTTRGRGDAVPRSRRCVAVCRAEGQRVG
jgi:hypothetical protein